MTTNGEASSTDDGSDAASQVSTAGQAGEHSQAAGDQQTGHAGYSYSHDPVTGERLGGDLSERFNHDAASGAVATESSGGQDGHTGKSTDTTDSGSAQAAAGSQGELPDYAKQTYRTEDGHGDQDSHRSGHGFRHGM